jgi:predicted transcriptional regulator
MMISIDIEYLYIVPAIRRLVAEEFLSKGLTQKDIAKKMGFTPAAVNQYLKKKRATKVRFSKEEEQIIKEHMDSLLKGESSMKMLIRKVIKEFEQKGIVCRIHKSIEKTSCDCLEGIANENSRNRC